jgi:hypothetical protein
MAKRLWGLAEQYYVKLGDELGADGCNHLAKTGPIYLENPDT